MKYFLTIAASDTSGGAGIQQDLKVAQYYGFWGLSVITAITVQDFEQVYCVQSVDLNMLEAQIAQLFKTFNPDCIKIGLIPNSQMLDLIAFYLKKTNAFVVLDPVLKSSSGFDFVDKDYISILKSILLKNISILTPNSYEFGLLNDKVYEEYAMALQDAKLFVKRYKCAIYLKGGHFIDKQIKEAYISHDNFQELSYERNKWVYSHGTGCAFSSALAINSIIHSDIKKVLHESHRYVQDFYEALNI
ncbi:MAG: hydroxymethylpyrimidine/phosphomethylpyrimidine kinase [Candidatus Cloacimonadales bacterium]|jgi:hydroxymethylpyrimidine/phosphomethylpyrimidine kinase|nr:hydroxymethylpyrimidine/phosphomethylpyrimidine kinase [Candidatus Cloacimonadota bacterium]MDD3501856.1 hydroxymethylpyrimidine/phosphomethylpyrimidine kinase [Candidatus Cloacimonadota bacterium]MDX9976629.1 hydroxymethylpyrimidine/phosphomethylpyrimidine kinase [Candidatus Cloacimonadales bacterium]